MKEPSAFVVPSDKLDLELALMSAGSLCKNVQDQSCASKDASRENTLEISLLHGTQFLVEQDHAGIELFRCLPDFIQLA